MFWFSFNVNVHVWLALFCRVELKVTHGFVWKSRNCHVVLVCRWFLTTWLRCFHVKFKCCCDWFVAAHRVSNLIHSRRDMDRGIGFSIEFQCCLLDSRFVLMNVVVVVFWFVDIAVQIGIWHLCFFCVLFVLSFFVNVHVWLAFFAGFKSARQC